MLAGRTGRHRYELEVRDDAKFALALQILMVLNMHDHLNSEWQSTRMKPIRSHLTIFIELLAVYWQRPEVLRRSQKLT